jgi:hypothetical protein
LLKHSFLASDCKQEISCFKQQIAIENEYTVTKKSGVAKLHLTMSLWLLQNWVMKSLVWM